jgi:dihydroorotase
MNPPLRTAADVEEMLTGLADGTIDCIATDHAPHNPLDKETTFEEAANGVIGLETSLPLVIEFLLRPGIITESRLVELMSVGPSRILKLGRGTLAPGAIADVTVIDSEKEVVIDATKFRSKARNCPFHGWKLHGSASLTMVRGRIVYSADSR